MRINKMRSKFRFLKRFEIKITQLVFFVVVVSFTICSPLEPFRSRLGVRVVLKNLKLTKPVSRWPERKKKTRRVTFFHESFQKV